MTVEIPRRMRGLPRDHRGYLVPHFVSWLKDGKPVSSAVAGAEPNFHLVAPGTIDRCHRFARCWLCGEPIGNWHAYVIGPMCAVNRTTSEPGSHLDCAQYAVQVCPFLSNPAARRPVVYDRPVKPAGIMLERNPGVTAIWLSRKAGLFTVKRGDRLPVADAPHLVCLGQSQSEPRGEA